MGILQYAQQHRLEVLLDWNVYIQLGMFFAGERIVVRKIAAMGECLGLLWTKAGFICCSQTYYLALFFSLCPSWNILFSSILLSLCPSWNSWKFPPTRASPWAAWGLFWLNYFFYGLFLSEFTKSFFFSNLF